MPGCDDAEADRIVGTYLDSGHRVIEAGGGGPRELDMVGRALRGRRGSVVLAAKVVPPVESGAVDAILRSLGTDRLDLLHLIRFPDTPVDATLATLDALVRAGSVGHVGLGNATATQLVEATDAARRLGLTPPVSLQVEHSLLARGIEAEVIPACERLGLAVLARSPLANGVLAGRYRHGTAPDPDSRVAFLRSHPSPHARSLADSLTDGRHDRVVDEVAAIAAELG